MEANKLIGLNDPEEGPKLALEEIRDIHNSIVNNPMKPKMQESIFAGYFLPRILGEEYDDTWPARWLSVTISPSAEVDVMHDRTGEYLYTVPPLLATNAIPTVTMEPNGLKRVLEEYKMKVAHIPMVGEYYLSNELDNKTRNIMHNLGAINSSDRWIYILEKYNKLPKELLEVKEKQKEEDDDSWLDFD